MNHCRMSELLHFQIGGCCDFFSPQKRAYITSSLVNLRFLVLDDMYGAISTSELTKNATLYVSVLLKAKWKSRRRCTYKRHI